MSLLKRLAAVGLGRRDEEEHAAARPVIRPVGPAISPIPPRPAPRPLPEAVSDYARRQAPQGLDAHGRQAPVNKSAEEDQLEIPAFLRRQAN
jgi:cell division protein FtsZ